ncbi:MAG: NUDIX hydrolase [Planctomycetes bacterium]|nr:NUDIX hydrolase [Planctomycetota bacterium]
MAKFTYDYPRPAVTVDVAIVTIEPVRRILLIRRKKDPFAGRWALPGGLVDENERLIDAAKRELREETELEDIDLEQLQAYGDPGRDPRGWTVSVVFLARVRPKQLKPRAADDASEVDWFPLAKLPKLAFDHAEILKRVRQRCEPRKRK